MSKDIKINKEKYNSAENLMIEHRIAVIPEYEGGFHAKWYGDDAESYYEGYGKTPTEAINNALNGKYFCKERSENEENFLYKNKICREILRDLDVLLQSARIQNEQVEMEIMRRVEMGVSLFFGESDSFHEYQYLLTQRTKSCD